MAIHSTGERCRATSVAKKSAMEFLRLEMTSPGTQWYSCMYCTKNTMGNFEVLIVQYCNAVQWNAKGCTFLQQSSQVKSSPVKWVERQIGVESSFCPPVFCTQAPYFKLRTDTLTTTIMMMMSVTIVMMMMMMAIQR